IRDGRRTLDRPLTDELLRGCDAIQDLLAAAVDGRPATIDVDKIARDLGRGIPANPDAVEPIVTIAPTDDLPGRSAVSVRPAARQTVRVRIDRLDRLLNLAGELMIGRQAQQTHLAAIEELTRLVAQQERSLLALNLELQSLRLGPHQQSAVERQINAALNTGERIGSIVDAQLDVFGRQAADSAQLITDLEQEVMAARLLPISTLFANLPRAVRELARDLGRDVQLTLAGETTELDRKVIEALGDTLTHLLRNALDHGIEAPDIREQLGKPRSGQITIAASSVGTHAQISIRDDGCGMDPQALRETAVRKGLLTNDAAARLTDHEALELIFMPGFTTARLITDVSGRGVGMDVVRTNVTELGGQVLLDTQRGSGTTVTLILPLTLVTTRVLLIEVGNQLFGLPASGCQGIIWIMPDTIRTIEGRATVTFGERVAPLLHLGEILRITPPRPLAAQRMVAVMIGTPVRPVALLVDQLVDEREAVVKSLGPLLADQRRYSGALQLGDGRIALLLNPVTLAEQSRSAAPTIAAEPVTAQRSRRLLVVDDSFATRELIRSMLTTSGYDVTTAVDGADALDKLRADLYDLIVTDVEMPRVDGFALTSRIRTELGLSNLPVIIITSLASDTHRRRGLEAGAQAYIVKSQFDQGNLLETIRQLL
ncbi:MAG TPA: hybrid sensor histidine kinase/response regulator, partial [Roseiflexaceae bacterium]|nr:hybrid sensor histidine kinase/response regulator [Roseiflexaceae bacterium]